MAKKTQVIKFKKSPMAPKRFKSAYMFFSERKHKELRQREEYKKLRAADIAKLVSQSFKALSDSERNKWQELARLDRERYEREKASYKGPWKVPDIGKNIKGGPKKPMSAFLRFSNERRSDIAQANPSLNGTQLSCLLAKLWRECPADLKQAYRDREARERAEFKLERQRWEKEQQMAKWIEAVPNAENLCAFLEQNEQDNQDDSSGMTESIRTQQEMSCLMKPPVSHPTPAEPNVMEQRVPFSFPVPTSCESENLFDITPFLNQFSTLAHPVKARSSACYDNYSLDDVLQDEELFFEDFSPRDVGSLSKQPNEFWASAANTSTFH